MPRRFQLVQQLRAGKTSLASTAFTLWVAFQNERGPGSTTRQHSLAPRATLANIARLTSGTKKSSSFHLGILDFPCSKLRLEELVCLFAGIFGSLRPRVSWPSRAPT